MNESKPGLNLEEDESVVEPIETESGESKKLAINKYLESCVDLEGDNDYGSVKMSLSACEDEERGKILDQVRIKINGLISSGNLESRDVLVGKWKRFILKEEKRTRSSYLPPRRPATFFDDKIESLVTLKTIGLKELGEAIDLEEPVIVTKKSEESHGIVGVENGGDFLTFLKPGVMNGVVVCKEVLNTFEKGRNVTQGFYIKKHTGIYGYSFVHRGDPLPVNSHWRRETSDLVPTVTRGSEQVSAGAREGEARFKRFKTTLFMDDKPMGVVSSIEKDGKINTE